MIMNDSQILKPGWAWVKFGDVVRLNTARCADPAAEGIERYIGLEHIEPEDLRIRRWGLVTEGTTFTNRFQPGQVLFGKRRAYQRKVAVADFAGVCSGDIYVFEPKDERLLPELLSFLCQTERFFEYAVGTSAGSLSPRTNWTQLANYEFALPPLEEQQRIVKLLLQIEETVIEFVQVKPDIITLQRALLQDLWDNADSYINIGSVISFGPQNGLYLPASYYGKGTPIIRIDSFYSGRILQSYEWQSVDIQHDTQNRYAVCANDILVNRVNSKEFVGKSVLVPSWTAGFVFESNIMRFRVNECQALPAFIAAYMNHPTIQQQIAARRKDAINQSSINQEDLKTLVVPRIDLIQQEEYVKRLMAIGNAETAVEERQLFILSLKQSLRQVRD
jgi:type I restriction enzyme S subunit